MGEWVEYFVQEADRGGTRPNGFLHYHSSLLDLCTPQEIQPARNASLMQLRDTFFLRARHVRYQMYNLIFQVPSCLPASMPPIPAPSTSKRAPSLIVPLSYPSIHDFQLKTLSLTFFRQLGTYSFTSNYSIDDRPSSFSLPEKLMTLLPTFFFFDSFEPSRRLTNRLCFRSNKHPSSVKELIKLEWYDIFLQYQRSMVTPRLLRSPSLVPKLKKKIHTDPEPYIASPRLLCINRLRDRGGEKVVSLVWLWSDCVPLRMLSLGANKGVHVVGCGGRKGGRKGWDNTWGQVNENMLEPKEVPIR